MFVMQMFVIQILSAHNLITDDLVLKPVNLGEPIVCPFI